MRKLDRWILLELFWPMVFSVLTFSALLFGTVIFVRILKLIVEFSPPAGFIGQIMWLAMPGVIVMAVPMATLLGSILAYSRLSASHEITAAVAGGISYGRLMIPLALVCFVISCGVLFLSDVVVPNYNAQMKEIQQDIRKGQIQGVERRTVFMKLPLGMDRQGILIASAFTDGMLKRVSMYGVGKEGQNEQYITAEIASFAGEGKWLFQHGYAYRFDKEGNFQLQSKFKEFSFDLGTDPEGLERASVEPGEVSFGEWKAIIDETKSKSIKTTRELRQMTVELHQKIAIPFACLAFALMGAPLGMKPQRTSGSLGLGISVLVILLYYVMMLVGRSLGASGALPEVLGAWLPNLILMGAAGFFTMRIARQV